MTDKTILTKEEIREAANIFANAPKGRKLTIDEAAELICTVDAFEAGIEWMQEQLAETKSSNTIPNTDQSAIRFKKPTDEQVINFAIMVNEGGLDPGKLTDMVAMSQMIIDRLYENGDIMIPSKIENNDREELTEDKIFESVHNALDKPESKESFEKWLESVQSPSTIPSDGWIADYKNQMEKLLRYLDIACEWHWDRFPLEMRTEVDEAKEFLKTIPAPPQSKQ